MKKLITQPEDVAREMREGIVALSPCSNSFRRKYSDPSQAVGAWRAAGRHHLRRWEWHEPAHAGYGTDADRGCNWRRSPNSDAVLTAIRAFSGPAGAVLIVIVADYDNRLTPQSFSSYPFASSGGDVPTNADHGGEPTRATLGGAMISRAQHHVPLRPRTSRAERFQYSSGV